MILKAFFNEGFVLDGMEEPTFDEDATPKQELDWDAFTTIPPAFVARLRLIRN